MDPTPPSQANATGDGRGRRVAAFLLSLVEPGAGHFLHGRFRRGAVWAVGLPALALGTLLASRGPYLFHGAIAALAIALLGRLAVALDSLRAARERPAWRSILAGWAALLAVELAVVAPV